MSQKEEIEKLQEKIRNDFGFCHQETLFLVLINEMQKLNATMAQRANSTKGSFFEQPIEGALNSSRAISFNGGAAAAAPVFVPAVVGSLCLRFPPSKKISVIKIIRDVFGLGLKQAKEVSEGHFLETDSNTVQRLNEEFRRQINVGQTHIAETATAYLKEM